MVKVLLFFTSNIIKNSWGVISTALCYYKSMNIYSSICASLDFL